MSKWRVIFETGASSAIEVEADNADDAIEAAYDETPSLCAQCSGWGQRAGVELGDWEHLEDEVEEIG